MKFHLLSDIHLELASNQQSYVPSSLDVDVVILAGDVGRHTHGLAWAANAFGGKLDSPKVIYVAGNHEYYDAHLGLLAEFQKPAWKQAGVHFLERQTLELPGVRFLGCTLWSGFNLNGDEYVEANMRVARQHINDYWVIQARGGNRLEPSDTLKLHKTAVRWLDAELSRPFDGKTVVVTHFAPHQGCVAPQFLDSELSPYFVTDLAWLMEKHSIDVWCHGHTHTNNDFIAENGCRMISNQRGYPQEVASGNTGFHPELVIEI